MQDVDDRELFERAQIGVYGPEEHILVGHKFQIPSIETWPWEFGGKEEFLRIRRQLGQVAEYAHIPLRPAYDARVGHSEGVTAVANNRVVLRKVRIGFGRQESFAVRLATDQDLETFNRVLAAHKSRRRAR